VNHVRRRDRLDQDEIVQVVDVIEQALAAAEQRRPDAPMLASSSSITRVLSFTSPPSFPCARRHVSSWPFAGDLSQIAVGHADVASNVTNGVDYVGAIARRVVPYETCRISADPLQPFCELVYDEESAYIEGTVSEETCEANPFHA
jgi:hypothetical protein